VLSIARYAESNAVTRAMLSEFLSPQDFQDLLRAAPAEAWAVLSRTAYGPSLPETAVADPLGVDALLRHAAAQRFKRAIRTLKGRARAVGRILLSRWDLDNLEYALRVWHKKETALQQYLSTQSLVHDVRVLDVCAAQSIRAVAEVLKRSPYFEPVSLSAALYESEASTFHVEVALEKDYYARLLAALAALGKTETREGQNIVALEIDLLNLSWLARLRQAEVPEALLRSCMVPGPSALSKRLAASDLSAKTLAEAGLQLLGDAGGGPGASELERIALLESLLTTTAAATARKLLSGFPFHIGCVFAFYLLIRLELRNLRAVFAGKAAGAGENEIRARLYGLE